MYIALGAEEILAAERKGEKIAVEIKSFTGTSSISQFHTAVGQGESQMFKFIFHQYQTLERN